MDAVRKAMTLIRMHKYNLETLKVIWKVLLFVLRKCWLQVTLLIFTLSLAYLLVGPLLTTAFALSGLLLVLYSTSDWLLYHPDDPPDSRYNVCSPSALKLPFVSTFVKTRDGVDINLVLIKQEAGRFSDSPTVVYLHGNAGNIGHRLLNVSQLYKSLQCNVLMVEYRGYGLSKGRPSEGGLCMDAEAALDYLVQHPGIDGSRIILFGRSLGAAVAIRLASRRPSAIGQRIRALVVENSFTSIPSVAVCLFNYRAIRWVPRWFYKSRFDSLSSIAQVEAPTLFLSGQADELIPPSMMHSLYEACPSPTKEWQSFETGCHNFTWKCPGYYKCLQNFLKKVFQEEDEHLYKPSIYKNPELLQNQPVLISMNNKLCNNHSPVEHPEEGLVVPRILTTSSEFGELHLSEICVENI